MMIASIFLDKTAYCFDKAFDYIIDDDLLDLAKLGCRVIVPFGRYNSLRQGIIVSTREKQEQERHKIKKIKTVIDDEPVLNWEMLKLVILLKDRCFCTVFQALRLIIPTGLEYDFENIYSLNNASCADISTLSEDKKEIIAFIKSKNNYVNKKILLKVFGEKTEYILNILLKDGFLKKETNTSRKTKDLTVKVFKLSKNSKFSKLTEKQKSVYDFLKNNPLSNIKEICYYTSVGISVIKTLEKKGIIVSENQSSYREPFFLYPKKFNKKIVLSSEQECVFENLKKQYETHKASVALLYGVTGSGKTSVFMKLIEYVRKDNLGIILMVPEIALTSKLVSVFKQLYGKSVAVFHSGLSLGERLDEFKRVKNGIADIVIGTRSAVFAPLEKIGLIIIDEEQESCYKSSQTPMFHARDIAKLRSKEYNAMLLLSSATPAIESYYMAKKGKYSLNKLSIRYGKAKLPEVRIIDMNEELLSGNNGIFSNELLERLNENIRNGEQSILLLNRRGYHTFASCKMCGEVVTCPNCSISMTYHSANNKLMCHYCGYSCNFTEKCPSCGENFIRCTGFGTQKIESDLKKHLGNARVLRMDADTTMAKNSHDKKLRQFENGEFDILIGTQMVAKGLDFENVTLVGVILADQSLYSDEFRSYEKAFDLLTQVVGRCGRGRKKGMALIQTYTPENPIIKMAAEQNYDAFYDSEIKIRKAMLYPPFSDICIILFSSENDEDAFNSSKSFLEELKSLLYSSFAEQPLRVLGPSIATISKIKNKYRYKIIIKCRNNSRFRKMIAQLLIIFSSKKCYKSVRISADINPDLIL